MRPDGVYPDLAGYAEEAILGVRDGDLTAIVSKTAVTHIEMGYENLRCHENVIARIMETYDVLPMSFSTICASLTEVSAILRKYGVQFRENLDRVSGKVELGMKVFHKLEPEGGEPSGGPAASPRDYIMGKFEKYLDQKKQNEKLFAAIDEVHRELSGIADDGCYTKPMKKQLDFQCLLSGAEEQKIGFRSSCRKCGRGVSRLQDILQRTLARLSFHKNRPGGGMRMDNGRNTEGADDFTRISGT